MANYKIDPNDPLPRYYQVYLSLLERIRTGEFKLGEAIPSERQLVGNYNTSRITIVKALDLLVREGLISRQQGRGNFVTSPTTILEAQPCKVAFLIGRTTKPYPYTVLMGAIQVALQNNIQLQVIGSHMTAQESRQVQQVLHHGIDGILLYPTPDAPNEALYREVRVLNVPFVMVDRFAPNVDSDRVVFDDQDAGYKLTELLIQKGHTRIAIVPLAEVTVTSVRNRIRGYRKALEVYGLPYDEELVWLDVYETLDRDKPLSENLPSYKKLLSRIEKDAATALIAINYDVAEQIIADLAKIRAEYKSPVQGKGGGEHELNVALAAISFRHFEHQDPSLIALAMQSGETLGARVMELLIKRLDKSLVEPPQSIVLPMELVQL